MEKLSNDWLTSGLMDSEYKKYILLAYFQNVQKAFNKIQLYPTLAELVAHYKNLLSLKEGKDQIANKFPKKVNGVNFEKLELEYEELLSNDEYMKQLEEVMEFAIPKFKNSLEEGKEIYEFVERNCDFSAVGLLPLYVDEGYFFLNASSSSVSVYRYHLTVIENSDQRYRAIHVKLLNKLSRGIGHTYESLKTEVIRKYNDLPNPATFLVQSKLKFPYHPTLLPVAKRLIVRYLSAA